MTDDHSNEGRETAPPRAAVLSVLRAAGLLDATPDDRFDRVTRLVRDVLDVPVCLVSMIDEDRQVFKSALGLAEPWASRRETPLSHSFCKHVVRDGEPLVVPDAYTDARVSGNPAVRELKVVAYLGVPIHLAGTPIGALCAISDQPRDWTAQDLERLKDFAAIIDSELVLHRLADERDTARRQAELLAREQAHRTKNTLAIAASLVSLSAEGAASVDEASRTARARIMALSAAQRLGWTQQGEGELGLLLRTVLGPYTLDGDSMIEFDGHPVPLPEDKVAPLGLIFHELATNASKHGALSDAGGKIDLGWRADGDRLAIRWSERPPGGRGLADDSAAYAAHAEKLQEDSGFGTRLVGLCARQLHAELEVGERPDGGREIEIRLPWPGTGAAL